MVDERCTICGDITLVRTHSGFYFHECRGCGYGQLVASGRSDYWSTSHGSLDDHEYWTRVKQRYFDSALSLLGHLVPGRRLLDLGGGIGYFAERALERGWDAYTLDTSPTAAESASERIGPTRSLTDMRRLPKGSFDAVTMWCVIAHTRDPVALVSDARRLLRDGGVVWATTPNFAFQKPYAAARLRLGRRLDFGHEDHVGHFTNRSARHLFRVCGFTDVRFHFRGITETCIAADSSTPLLVHAKRAWNAFGAKLLPVGIALVSELQITARASG